ncbi:MAG TPA: XdhC family protein [Gammaproteobacteria bacterium]|nr:XdhC family protein [Gammaproteobacteria bacterium]
MSVQRIIQSFRDWQRSGEPMVLATVYETLGSTYSKAGHRILIAANGDYQGLVSGGCLEGDVAERARTVLESGTPATVTYDMRDEADDIWGLGVGCNGLIRVFLQPLRSDSGYEPFAGIVTRLLAARPSSVGLVIASRNPVLPAGATLIWDGGAVGTWQLDARGVERLASGCAAVVGRPGARYERGDGELEVLYSPLEPIPRLLVLGAGLDAVPLVKFAAGLGWQVTVADHRPAYLDNGDFSAATESRLIRPAELASTFDLDTFHAIVVMSHHLLTDQAYLAQLAGASAAYLGVLGPRARRERLLDALGEAGATLRARLKGPVGLDIGADSPESIALSVLAEIHAQLKGVSGAVAARSSRAAG